MNDYLIDAIFFLSKVPKYIKRTMNKDEILDATLFWALGIERILKGILYELNPIFVFSEISFKNLTPILYKHKIVTCDKYKSVFKEKPNADVITFKNSIFYAREISQTAKEYNNRLFSLNSNRDILAHCNLNQISLEEAKLSLQRDFYSMINSFCGELHIDSENIFQKYKERLKLLSTPLEERQKLAIERLLEIHKDYWNKIKDEKEVVDQISIDMSTYKRKNPGYIYIECPACANEAVLEIEPDVDIEGSECIYYGLSIGLECKYCELTVDDPDDLDYLDINEGTIFS